MQSQPDAVEIAQAPQAEVGQATAAAPRAGARPLPIWRRPGRVMLHAPSTELQDLKDKYLSWMIATRYAETTIKGAHINLEWFFKFLTEREVTRIADVTPDVMNEYSLWIRENKNHKHEGKALAARHIYYRIVSVKWFFAWLAQNMLVLCDPAVDLELPQIHQGLPETILTQEEVKRLLAAPDMRSPIGYRDKALLELVYATGIRTRELLRLNVADLDFKARTVFVREGKGGKDRILPLPAVAVGYLKEFVEKVRPRFAKLMKNGDDGTLFIGYTGGKLDKSRLSEIFKRSRKLAALDKPVTPMILRHSIATHLLENGLGLRYIQEFLGHERLQTSTLYAKCSLLGLRCHFNKHHPREKRVRKNGVLAECENKITQDNTRKLTIRNG
ncbi:MAG: tyrosine-type recombinase/integrase [Elusimicrobia bacterium]|nr:tyrosine-type recombinase/integrase [Elusimicrobiota bacterium]